MTSTSCNPDNNNSFLHKLKSRNNIAVLNIEEKPNCENREIFLNLAYFAIICSILYVLIVMISGNSI